MFRNYICGIDKPSDVSQNRSSLPLLSSARGNHGRQVIVEVDGDDPKDGYMGTRRPQRFVSTGRDPKMFNRGTADARRLAVDQMIRALAAKAEADLRQEEAARRDKERRRMEQNRRRLRSLQRQVERGQPLEPSQQAVLGYYTALKNNMDDDDKMAKNVLQMLLRLHATDSKSQ